MARAKMATELKSCRGVGSTTHQKTGALLDTTEMTPHARPMGKNSSKDIVEMGEKVLAKIHPVEDSTRGKQTPQTQWKEAVWVGIAKISNEHIVFWKMEDNQMQNVFFF